MWMWLERACNVCKDINETAFQSVLEKSCNKLISPTVPHYHNACLRKNVKK